MPVVKKGGYSLPLQCAATTPNDSTAYMLGNSGNAMTTTTTGYRVYVLKSGTIQGVYLSEVYVNGSAENVVHEIEVNAATAYTLETVTWASTPTYVLKTDLAIPVTAGDYLFIKITTPAWASNPTALNIKGLIYIETG